MSDILTKKLTLSKKGNDGKFHAVAWIQKSDKYDNLTCSISVENMKSLLASAEGKYAYCSVFIDDAEKKEEKKDEPAVEVAEVSDSIPF